MKLVILEAKGICKAFGSNDILKNINFRVEQSDRIGVVGPNGAGKTTLMRIITSMERADAGEIYISGGCSIGYLAQDIGLNTKNSIWEEMLSTFSDIIAVEQRMHELEQAMSQGLTDNRTMAEYARLSDEFERRDGYSYESYMRGVLTGLGFSADEFEQPISILSGGQKTRVALGKLLLQRPDILLLDEPTNHLDIEAVQWLEDFLKNYNHAVIIVSHDRYFMDAVCTKIFDIYGKTLDCYDGNYSRYTALKRAAIAQQDKAYELQQKEIKRQQEIIERFRSYNREKSIKAAESRQKMLDRRELIDKPHDEQAISFTFTARQRGANEALNVKNLSKPFETKCVLNNITFELKRGRRAAIIGPNGIGKSTLLKIIAGQWQASSGKVHIGDNTSIGYYDQEHTGLDPNKTVLDELWDAYPFLSQTDVRKILAVFLFKGDDVFKKVSNLSGGERARLALAKLMPAGYNMLLLDEPTNHLDISSREALEDALKDYDGTLLVVSHDRYFINKIADTILELLPDGITCYEGNYDDYRQQKYLPEPQIPSDSTAKVISKAKKPRPKASEPAVADIEAEILAIEERISELEATMCEPEVFTDGQQMRRLKNEYDSLKSELEALYEQWA